MSGEEGGDGDDGNVGYGRPPRHTRFQKGVSGNSKGRPKGSKSVQHILEVELARKIRVQEAGKTKTYTVLEVAVKALASNAARGKLESQRLLFSMLSQATAGNEQGARVAEISSQDMEALRGYFERNPPEAAQ